MNLRTVKRLKRLTRWTGPANGMQAQALAQLVTHVPNKGEQMVRYYGFYSNKSRGLRKKAGVDDQVPALIESEISTKESRRNWGRLIQKIYHVDPLLCPKCSNPRQKIIVDNQACFCYRNNYWFRLIKA